MCFNLYSLVAHLCRLFNLTAERLYSKWEAFVLRESASAGNGGLPDKNEMLQLNVKTVERFKTSMRVAAETAASNNSFGGSSMSTPGVQSRQQSSTQSQFKKKKTMSGAQQSFIAPKYDKHSLSEKYPFLHALSCVIVSDWRNAQTCNPLRLRVCSTIVYCILPRLLWHQLRLQLRHPHDNWLILPLPRHHLGHLSHESTLAKWSSYSMRNWATHRRNQSLICQHTHAPRLQPILNTAWISSSTCMTRLLFARKVFGSITSCLHRSFQLLMIG